MDMLRAEDPRGGRRRDVRLSRPVAWLLGLLLALSWLVAGLLLARGDQRATIHELERQLDAAQTEALTARVLKAELDESRRLQEQLLIMLGVPRPDLPHGAAGDTISAAVPPGGEPLRDIAASVTSPPPTKWPVAGAIIREFTQGDRPNGIEEHPGVDIAAPAGTPVVAAADGEVDFVGEDDVLGKYLEIRHGFDYVTVYGNCSWIGAGPGHRVWRGEQVAKVGSTGSAKVAQLHFEVWNQGVAVDPRKVLAGEPTPR